MKVWGGMAMKGGEQRRVFMAGTIKDFGEATGLTRDYMAATGNAAELEVALSEPGVLFFTLDRHGMYFCPASQVRYCARRIDG